MPSAVLEALGGDAGSARTASSALHLPPTRLPACLPACLPIHLPARCRGMPLPPCCPFSCGARRAAPTATLTGCPSPAPLGVAWWTLTQLSLTASSPVPFRLARTCELSTCPLPRFALRCAAQRSTWQSGPLGLASASFAAFTPTPPGLMNCNPSAVHSRNQNVICAALATYKPFLNSVGSPLSSTPALLRAAELTLRCIQPGQCMPPLYPALAN
jgi:hypothetical protein